MLSLLVPLIIAFAAPSPVPSASAQPPSTLKEIGRIQSLSVCPAIVVHANSAIGAVLDNDAQLALTVNRLRTTDLDTDNVIAKHNGMTDLATLAGRLRMGAAAGTGEIKRLRAIAGETADPARKAELKAFADALGGALARQRKIGTDLDRMLAIIDGRRAVEEVNTDDLAGQRDALASPGQAAGPRGSIPQDVVMRSPVAGPERGIFNPTLRDVADEFAARSSAILVDEGTAADHALGATTGC